MKQTIEVGERDGSWCAVLVGSTYSWNGAPNAFTAVKLLLDALEMSGKPSSRDDYEIIYNTRAAHGLRDLFM